MKSDYIVLKGVNEGNFFSITKRGNFEETTLCECYDNNGQIIGCYEAGCYSLDNSGSVFVNDLLQALDGKFETKRLADFENSSFSDIEDFINILDLSKEEEEFARKWANKNTIHHEVIAWTYHDSHNFQSCIIEDYEGVGRNIDAEELDEEEQQRILEEMPETPYINGTNKTIETENYFYHFDRWADNPYICHVQKK